jgi:hypothetical protein
MCRAVLDNINGAALRTGQCITVRLFCLPGRFKERPWRSGRGKAIFFYQSVHDVDDFCFLGDIPKGSNQLLIDFQSLTLIFLGRNTAIVAPVSGAVKRIHFN